MLRDAELIALGDKDYHSFDETREHLITPYAERAQRAAARGACRSTGDGRPTGGRKSPTRSGTSGMAEFSYQINLTVRIEVGQREATATYRHVSGMVWSWMSRLHPGGFSSGSAHLAPEASQAARYLRTDSRVESS